MFFLNPFQFMMIGKNLDAVTHVKRYWQPIVEENGMYNWIKLNNVRINNNSIIWKPSKKAVEFRVTWK